MNFSPEGADDDLDAPSVGSAFERRPGFAELRSLKRELLAEQQSRWAEGKPVSPEELLQRWPTDPQADGDVASVLFEDLLQRRLQGEDPSVDEYSQKFPEHKLSLEGLISHQDFLRSVGMESSTARCLLRFPEVGDELFGFRFRHELGRGAFARVFLAEQMELAGRAVAVKVSAIEGNEPQTLAQMQHTHIVPIYAVQEDSRSGLRAVCMPYFGGASLSRVLREIWAESKLPVHGRQLVDALERVQSPTTAKAEGQAAIPSPGPAPLVARNSPPTPLALLRGESYIRAVAWVVARLAEGLQHAHQRGVLHRDIKPANILIGADGQPMLLDFNLSQDQNDESAKAILGGTVAYMAPEHLRAMSRRTSSLINQVDQRSDIYSLGMVLYETLTGKKPFEQSASYSVVPLQLEAMAVERSLGGISARSGRLDVPWSLESILRKCLAPMPADRYQQAEDLAEDLRCFLEDRPLRYAPELSRAERIAKWTRRHPRLTYAGAVTVIAGLLLMTTGAALVAVKERLKETHTDLGAVRERLKETHSDLGYVQWKSGDASEAVVSFTKALEGDPGSASLWWNRGLARLELKRYQEALADFDEALRLEDHVQLHAGRGMALEGLGRHPEADAAFQLTFTMAAAIPPAARLQMTWSYGFAVAARLPDKAQWAFDEVHRQDPKNKEALYGLAMLAMQREDAAATLRYFDQSLEVAPNFFAARRYRAIQLARKGDLNRATEDINWCLEKEPQNGDSLYAAACVVALASKQLADPKLAEQSRHFLEKALSRGVDLDKANHDPDLAAIRARPEIWQAILQARENHSPRK